MKSKPFGRAMFENRIIKTMITRNIDHDINIFILNKLFDRFFKIKSGNKIKLRIVFGKLFSKPCSFFFQLFIECHMYLAIYIYNMKIGFEEIKHRFQVSNRSYLFYIFKIGGKRHIID